MSEHSKTTKKNMWQRFVTKQRFNITDADDGREKWHLYISPMRALVGMVSLLLVLFVAVMLIVTYTPLLDRAPGYPGRKSREMLVKNILRLDSLEREMNYLAVYGNNISLIIDGKTPVVRDVAQSGDSIEITEKYMIAPNAADSLLRIQMQGDGEYSLSASASAERAQRSRLELMAPVQGLVQTQFDPVRGNFGVEVVTASNQPVIAVREGTVVLSMWTPVDGYVIQIQHPGNFLSIYKHITQVQLNVGSRVRSGEVLGLTGVITNREHETATGPFGFELWYNGSPVDPNNYITF